MDGVAVFLETQTTVDLLANDWPMTRFHMQMRLLQLAIMEKVRRTKIWPYVGSL